MISFPTFVLLYVLAHFAAGAALYYGGLVLWGTFDRLRGNRSTVRASQRTRYIPRHAGMAS